MVAQIEKQMLKAYPFKILGRLYSWLLVEGRPLTTKGRWINSIVFAGFKLHQLLPLKKHADRPIYIVGTGRSGTTVLGTLFSMHKSTVFLNEPKAAWHFIHGREDLIGSYSNTEASFRLKTNDVSGKATKLSKIYSSVMWVGFASRVVDKYPELVFRANYVTALFPRSKFIAILRDGVDTCASVTNWSKRKGVYQNGESYDWWGKNGRKWKYLINELIPEHQDLQMIKDKLLSLEDHRDRAAVEWIVSMREAKKISQKYPQVLIINFEDLCSETDSVLDQVLEHCNLEDDFKFREYAKNIVKEVESYSGLELMPELVAPFCDTLKIMGYETSCSRVKERS